MVTVGRQRRAAAAPSALTVKTQLRRRRHGRVERLASARAPAAQVQRSRRRHAERARRHGGALSAQNRSSLLRRDCESATTSKYYYCYS